MTTQIELQKTAKQYQIDERRKEIALLIGKNQNMTEIELAAILGVDNSTISKDIKQMKLISEQFVYDIAKSDFTYYYKQNLDLVRLVLAKQWELIDKKDLGPEDIIRWRLLTEILATIENLDGRYTAAKHLHMSIESRIEHDRRFGIRPGTKIRRKSDKQIEKENRETEEQERKEKEECRMEEIEEEKMEEQEEIENEEDELQREMRKMEREVAKFRKSKVAKERLDEYKHKLEQEFNIRWQ